MKDKTPLNENNKDNTKSLKIIIISFSCIIILCLLYIYKGADRPKKIIISLRHEKAIILKDLEKTQSLLVAIKTDNKNLEEKLNAEKTRISKFIRSIKTKNINKTNLETYQKGIDVSDERIKTLIAEIAVYRKKNDSITLVLKNEKSKNDTLKLSNIVLKKNNSKLTKKITEASNLSYYNVETKCFKIKNSKSETETNNANKIDLIKISFFIAENNFIKPTDKNFYIQIIDPKNNVIGLKETISFKNAILTYSKAINLKYENKNTKVYTELKVEKLEKGNYIVNVFDNSKNVLQSNFILN